MFGSEEKKLAKAVRVNQRRKTEAPERKGAKNLLIIADTRLDGATKGVCVKCFPE